MAKSKGPSPTSRTLAECRKRGWLAQGVEQVVPHTFIKRDLFGCIDLVALDGHPGVLGIQACSNGSAAGKGGDMSKRLAKIALECGPAALRWLGAGNRLEVWGWGKKGEAGTRKLWALRVIEVSAAVILAEQGKAQQRARAEARS